MNEHLRDRIVRRLDALSDERGYQVLDYVEFLESKYADRQSPSGNVFTKLTEAVEDKLRAGRVSANVISETMTVLNRASSVLNGAMAAGKSVANDIVSAVSQTADSRKPEPPVDAKSTPPAEEDRGTPHGS